MCPSAKFMRPGPSWASWLYVESDCSIALSAANAWPSALRHSLRIASTPSAPKNASPPNLWMFVSSSCAVPEVSAISCAASAIAPAAASSVSAARTLSRVSRTDAFWPSPTCAPAAPSACSNCSHCAGSAACALCAAAGAPTLARFASVVPRLRSSSAAFARSHSSNRVRDSSSSPSIATCAVRFADAASVMRTMVEVALRVRASPPCPIHDWRRRDAPRAIPGNAKPRNSVASWSGSVQPEKAFFMWSASVALDAESSRWKSPLMKSPKRSSPISSMMPPPLPIWRKARTMRSGVMPFCIMA